jgi:hypothetical protein
MRSHTNLDKPEVCRQGEKILKDFLAELRKSTFIGDSPKVYSQKKWIERGERYGTEGAAILTFDGSWLYEVFNHHDCSAHAQRVRNRFEALLKEAGFWYEIGEAWFLYIYEE